MSKGRLVGYVRVSTVDQGTDHQFDGMTLDRIFEDKVRGRNTNRPALQGMLKFVRKGDTVIVHSFDRLARNLDDLRASVEGLTEMGATVKFVKESLIFDPGDTNPINKMLLSVPKAFAEFERSIIRERQREGARQKNAHRGRVKVLDHGTVAAVKERLAAGVSKAKVAREFGISRPTLYAYLSDTS
jgi:DNA invertase Pin-like site-specific DNA recombinase